MTRKEQGESKQASERASAREQESIMHALRERIGPIFIRTRPVIHRIHERADRQWAREKSALATNENLLGTKIAVPETILLFSLSSRVTVHPLCRV